MLAIIMISTASCIIDGKEYMNGVLIPSEAIKADACTSCRCFYGRDMCQPLKCPSPPGVNCVTEPLIPGQCCPRYTCSREFNCLFPFVDTPFFSYIYISLSLSLSFSIQLFSPNLVTTTHFKIIQMVDSDFRI